MCYLCVIYDVFIYIFVALNRDKTEVTNDAVVDVNVNPNGNRNNNNICQKNI